MGDVIHIVDSCSAAAAMMRETGEHIGRGHVYSTHWSVVDYLTPQGIECIDISSYTQDAQLRGIIHTACDDLKQLLAPLDAALSPEICRLVGIPQMPLFDLIYRYHGHYNLTGLRLLSDWVEAELLRYDVVTVHYWHTREAATHPVFSFADVLRRATATHSAGFVEHAVSQRGMAVEQLCKRLRRLALTPRRALQRLRSLYETRSKARIADAASLAVVFEPEKCLPAMLAEYVDEVLLWPRSGLREVQGVPAISSSRWAQVAYMARSAMQMPGTVDEQALQQRDALELADTPHEEQGELRNSSALSDDVPAKEATTEPVPALHGPDAVELRNRVLEDFAARARELLEPAAYMQQVHRRFPVTVGAWAVPLVGTPSRLAAEVLMRCGVPVAGLQHGGCYLSQHLGEKHFMTDFTACTHFISYAGGQSIFEQTYSAEEITQYTGNTPCTVLRGGNVDHASPQVGTEHVDVVFPVTNAVDLFWTCRTGADRLARAQTTIMQTLDSRIDLSCIVKPFPHASRDSIAVTGIIDALSHCSVVQMGWRDFLERYKPLLTVIEFPSTPLYEALPYDVDIYLLTDATAPFTSHALQLLRKRVHVFDTADELVAALMDYSPEQFGALRDNGFYDAYVNTDAALNNVAAHLSEIIASRSK